jgi:hypothetical protein
MTTVADQVRLLPPLAGIVDDGVDDEPHGVVSATTCKTCHIGAYTVEGTTGALDPSRPTTSLRTTQLLNGAAMDCNACHTSTTTWGTMTMNHNGSQGGGAGWCKGCHATGTNFLGSMERKTLTTRGQGQDAAGLLRIRLPPAIGQQGQTYVEWD